MKLKTIVLAAVALISPLAFPQPAPGTAPSPGPMKVPEDQLRKMLGIANVNFKQNEQRLAIVDSPLQG